MRRIVQWTVLVLVAVLAAGFAYLNTPEAKDQVDYPEGYRNWTHVKSMVLQEGHPLYKAFGGIHHVYANEKALKALKKGTPFPDGSVLVFDLLEAKYENHAIVEGPRKIVGVMQKNAKKFSATGGWGYEGFKGDTRERVVKDPKNECHICHMARKDQDFVYSEYRR